MTTHKTDHRRSRAVPPADVVLLVAGVAFVGYNLRGAITSLPPLFPELAGRLHLSAATLSVLAAMPTACFGVVSSFAAWFGRRFGEERVLLGALVILTAGLLLRAAAPGALLLPGTIGASSAIAVMNVLLSSLIKRRWPQRAGLLVGAYITALSLGAIVGSLGAVPLWDASGGSVPLALGWLAAPAALAAVVWLPQSRYRTGGSASPVPADPGRPSPRARTALPVYKHALAWQVTVFMGTQSLLYYAALSWLPTIVRDRGASAGDAGNLLALMGAGNLLVSLIVPVLAQRMRSSVALVVPATAALAAGLAGAVYAPLGSAPLWVLILGMGQNATLSLAIFFTMARAPHPAAAASLSAFAQSVGYLLASCGPLGVGLLHSATGNWNPPVAVLFGLQAVMLVAGVLAARPRVLPDEVPVTKHGP
ncbi:MAG: MFS transporter [Nocardiopsaceae bacterium]|nr:MFS transporter [Nocardiopsaceae bacterium]